MRTHLALANRRAWGAAALIFLVIVAGFAQSVRSDAPTVEDRIQALEYHASVSGMAEVVAIDVQPGAGENILQGDALLVIGPGGRTLLVDAGYPEHAEQYVIPYLLGRGITHLDTVTFTHSNQDHMGGVLGLLQSPSVTVGQILTPDIDWDWLAYHSPALYQIERPLWDAIRAEAGAQSIPIATVYTDDELDLGLGAKAVVLHGWEAPVSFWHKSLVLRVEYGPGSVLLTGDAMPELWAWLNANKNIRAEVVKLPHHCDSATHVQLYLDAIGLHSAIATAPQRIVAEQKCVNVQQSLAARGMAFYSNGHDGHVSTFLSWRGAEVR